jgi:hypothetical protein
VRPISAQLLWDFSPMSVNNEYELKCQTFGSQPSSVITWWINGDQQRKADRTEVTHKTCLNFFLNIFFGLPHLATFILNFLFLCNSLHYRLHPSSIRCWGSNPQTLGHEPSALTTRPCLNFYFCFKNKNLLQVLVLL